ncbi:MAG: competence/damage-inducible protein A [Candidatus Omnitrophica bacterium]|nr:competence/damage-inducible protein A [Candidatus Omnitrophota bacterium]
MSQREVIVEFLSIGSELIKGEHEDNNSPYLSRELSKLGLQCRRVTVLPDFPHSWLVQTLQTLFKRSHLLILTGGLGPTEDDVTREAIAKALGKKLIFHPPLLEAILKRFKKRNLVMPRINKRQAYLPQGAQAIPNPLGSAPGILMEVNKKILISLPGVPVEMQAMFEKSVRPLLMRRFPNLSPSPSVFLRTTGLAESRVNELLQEIIRKEKKITFGFYAHPGIVDIKLLADSPRDLKILRKVAQEARRRLGPFLYGEGNRTLEETVFRLLEKKKKWVSVAESCTGGALSEALTRVPGSSRHFKVGVVAYSHEAKNALLKVPNRLIRLHGAVSPEVASSLAEQAKRLGQTDFGIGVTGILGPGGGTKQKPVGLVYIALASQVKRICHRFNFVGEREIIRERVVKVALDLLRRELLK